MTRGLRFLREDGGAIAVEAVLVLPVLLIVAAISAEFFALAQRRVVVEQAAYAAARSALVYKCPPPSLGSGFGTLTSLVAAGCEDRPDKWEDAARWTLISAAPGSGHALERHQCNDLPAAEKALRAAGLEGRLDKAMRNRICYAYEPGNLSVEVDWQIGALDVLTLANSGRTAAIEARVTYRYPVATPVGRLIADGTRPDGTRWIERTTSVVIR